MERYNRGDRQSEVEMAPWAKGLDHVLSLMGIVAASFLIVYTLIAGLSPQYLLVATMMGAVCLYWAIGRKQLHLREMDEAPAASSRTVVTLSIIFFALLTLSVLSIYFRTSLYERPLEYFIITAAMVGVVGMQTLMVRGKWTYLVFAQIMVIGLSLAWSQLSIFPGVMQADPWYHQLFTRFMLDEHHIPDFSYTNMPLFHLLVGSTSLVDHLDYKLAMMLSVSLGQVIVLVLSIFLLGRLITGSQWLGMLGALIMAFSDHFIMMAATAIPSSLAAAFVPLITLMLLMAPKKGGKAIGIAAFLMGAVVLTHTITSTWVAAFLVVGIIASFIAGKRERWERISTPALTAFFITIMIGWWGYASGDVDYLAELISLGFSKELVEPSRLLLDLPMQEQLLVAAGMYVLFALSLIGTFYLMARWRKGRSFEMALILATPLAIGFLSMLTGLFINQQRWFFFAQIALAVPAAISLCLIIGLPTRRRARMATMGCITAVVAFLMIAGGIANTDNPVLSPSIVVPAGQTLGELSAAQTTSSIGPPPAVDSTYANPFLIWVGYDFMRLDDSLVDRDFNATEGHLVLIRDAVAEGHTFDIMGGLYRLNYPVEEVLYSSGHYKVYDDGSVSGYLGQ